jgi:hypothetical protein
VVAVDETLRRTRLARSDIAAIDDSGASFMPEGLLTALNPRNCEIYSPICRNRERRIRA